MNNNINNQNNKIKYLSKLLIGRNPSIIKPLRKNEETTKESNTIINNKRSICDTDFNDKNKKLILLPKIKKKEKDEEIFFNQRNNIFLGAHKFSSFSYKKIFSKKNMKIKEKIIKQNDQFFLSIKKLDIMNSKNNFFDDEIINKNKEKNKHNILYKTKDMKNSNNNMNGKYNIKNIKYTLNLPNKDNYKSYYKNYQYTRNKKNKNYLTKFKNVGIKTNNIINNISDNNNNDKTFNSISMENYNSKKFKIKNNDILNIL